MLLERHSRMVRPIHSISDKMHQFTLWDLKKSNFSFLVVKVTVLLADVKDFMDMNEVYGECEADTIIGRH